MAVNVLTLEREVQKVTSLTQKKFSVQNTAHMFTSVLTLVVAISIRNMSQNKTGKMLN